MVVATSNVEFTSTVTPSRLFKALVLDNKTTMVKLNPAVKSAEYIQGDGGPGTITLITSQEGEHLKTVKTRIDAINTETFSYTYTLLREADGSPDEKIETITHEVQFIAGPDGGSLIKSKSTYTTNGDDEPAEEEIKKNNEKSMGIFKAVEAYLLQNPEA